MRRVSTDLRYEIYHTGKIIQYGDYEKAKKVNYTYIDNKGNKHGLGEWELIEADNYAKGTTTHIEADKCYSEYSNYYGKTIYYKRLKGKIKLVNIKDKKVDYENNEVCIMYQFKSPDFDIKISSFF